MKAMQGKKALTNYLIQAVVKNDVRRVSDLLNLGADPNYTLDSSHVTVLHYAAQNNSLEVIPLLVEAGSYIEAQTEPDGQTAMEIAFLHGHDKIAQALIAYSNESDTRLH